MLLVFDLESMPSKEATVKKLVNSLALLKEKRFKVFFLLNSLLVLESSFVVDNNSDIKNI
jgi:hypothetical protein